MFGNDEKERIQKTPGGFHHKIIYVDFWLLLL